MELAGIGLQPKFLTMDGHPKTCGAVGRATQQSLFDGLGAVVDIVRKVIRFEKVQDETQYCTLGLWTQQHESDEKSPRSGWHLPSTVSTERSFHQYTTASGCALVSDGNAIGPRTT